MKNLNPLIAGASLLALAGNAPLHAASSALNELLMMNEAVGARQMPLPVSAGFAIRADAASLIESIMERARDAENDAERARVLADMGPFMADGFHGGKVRDFVGDQSRSDDAQVRRACAGLLGASGQALDWRSFDRLVKLSKDEDLPTAMAAVAAMAPALRMPNYSRETASRLIEVLEHENAALRAAALSLFEAARNFSFLDSYQRNRIADRAEDEDPAVRAVALRILAQNPYSY